MHDTARRNARLADATRAIRVPLAVLRETGGRFETFARFQTAAATARSAASLKAAVSRVAGSPWPRLWAVEGTAFGWARARLRRGGGPTALETALAVAPRRLLLPLHTGVGMALAWQRLGRAPSAVSGIVALGRRIARPGCAAAVVEPLGFVTRVLRPRGLPALAAAAPPEWRPALWHGGGRGIYFSPAALRPGVGAAAFARGVEDSPAGVPRDAALAGVAWALTLVHLLRPRLVALVLEEQEQQFTGSEWRAVLGGVAGALVVWTSVYGEDGVWRAFLAAVPAAVEHYRRQHARWQRAGWGPLLHAPEPEGREVAA